MSYKIDAESAKSALAATRSEWSQCDKCALCKHRLTVVHGKGAVPCGIAIVGQHPGKQEDAQGEPFVGQGGEYLDMMLKVAKYPREKIFLTNVLGCVTPSEVAPTREMAEACAPRLHRELQCASPLVILAAGKYAASTLFGKATLALKDVLGVLTPITIQGQYVPYQVSMIATHHPTRLLRLKYEGSAEYRDLAKETFRHLCIAIDIANEYNRLKGG